VTARAETSAARRAGAILLLVVALAAVGAPWFAPNDPNERFGDLMYAPPTQLHLSGGGAPYIHPLRILSLRERTFEEDRSRAIPLRWFAEGHLVTADPRGGAPLMVLGADGYGRDIFSRLVHGARITLLVAVIATAGATLVGAVIGGVSGQSSGWIDATLSRITEFVLVLPAIYVALSLRGVLPLVLSASTVFVMLTGIFTLLGWPVVARGVRAIVLAERERDYAMAARAAGAGAARLLWLHLLPAANGYLLTQATLLLPAFILAEATMSFVGLGFPSTVATWGTMLQDAANVATLGDTPWTLAPALAIFLVVLGVNLVVQGSGRAPVQLEP
jgi:peptide/nickel transport system permease protein